MGTDAKGLLMEEVGFAGLSDQQSELEFDRIVQKNMNMSGDEFLKNWNSGVYDGQDWDDVDGLVEVVIAFPFSSKPRRKIQDVTGG